MCPKYPNADCLHFFELNIFPKASHLKLPELFLYGPSPTNNNIIIPPKTAIAEVMCKTDLQGNSKSRFFSKCGKAVPSTSAPNKKPSALPNPFSYQSAAIFIPTG